MKNRRRKALAGALVVTGLAGLGVAAAAQLSLSTAALGAGSDVVASCQPVDEPIGVSFAAGFAGGEYAVTAVTLDGLSATCAGQAARITLTGAGAPLGAEVTGPVAAGTTTFPVTAGVPAAALDGVAVVIHG